MIREMNREIEEIYSIQELEERKKQLRDHLQHSCLSEVEIWEVNDLIDTINKRIRLMNDLMIGLVK
ncbi:hypothetical protein [Ammoniphilus sp. CFH 90114]|uniref:hypothetical protein n=1 Tax=Ammoniphilus sp. CFH 90114 TaxID=2493665 RepID=UPI00100DD139|nr:hypothetical protein [Ammoniphilus sp. CFH 90114]RXT09077.1 hypothetical protein EIZ39_09900 [Ammoniphilus sp. CFH 90114]